MSIAIQKKRFGKKDAQTYSQKISQIEKADPLHQQYFQRLADFEVGFKKTCNQTTLKSLKGVLEGFYKDVKADEFYLTDLSKHGDSTGNAGENVFLVNRTANVVHMLADYIINKKSILVVNRRSFDLLDKMSSETRDVTLLCVKILKLFAIINIHFAVLLSNKPKFCSKMFELMLQDNKVYFKQVLGIQEALIASNPEVITPAIYPHIQEVLVHMPKKYFARFSRIIALFVLENSDKMDFKELPYDYNENKMIKVHSFLLGIPDLIETYTVVLDYLREIMERLISTNVNNLRKTVRYLKESYLIKDSGLNLSFLKPLFEQSQISEALATEIFTPKFMVKFMVKKSNLTEILFVISNLLLGKRKIEVQNRLRQINFMERIVNPLFDLLFHQDLDNGSTEDPFYSEDCNCSNPLATTRIQLLRIIINFCDRDSPNTNNKEMLLSAEEKTILYTQLIHKGLQSHNPNYSEDEVPVRDPKKLSPLINNMTINPKESVGPFFNEENVKTNAFESVQKKGLMNKIIALFGRFHPNSNYRFWLASCVESFLRGFQEAHQIFVAHSGLLYNLVNQILTKEVSKPSNVQISFDLVGEIVKFNKYNMVFLENICEKFEWTDLFAKQALANVVDSNVFLRALLLSFERFDHIYNKEQDAFLKENILNFNQQSQFYQRFSQDQMKWFHLIIEAVESSPINQDNICCVNTILIMAIFSDQKGTLVNYVKALATNEERSAEKSKEILQNFNNVLAVWHRYYMSKTKDSFSLQYTSSLPFSYFQYMKQKLQTLFTQNIEKLEN